MYENFNWKVFLTLALTLGAVGSYVGNDGMTYGLDLSGGDEIIYRLDFTGKMPSSKTADEVVEVIRGRLDKLGVKELSLARLGTDQFVVQVPNAEETEVKKIQSQIERAGQLYFKLVADGPALNMSEQDVQAEIERVRRAKRAGTWRENDRFDIAIWDEGVRGQAGAAELLENCTAAGKPLYVHGRYLADANKTVDERGAPAVGFEWNTEGSRKFYELTDRNKGRRLAVVLDGKLRSAPQIRAAIGKRGIIEGGPRGWDPQELNALIITLKAGALPAKPVFAYRKHVGAQLGRAAVRVGTWAILGSLAVVLVFMVWYYGLAAGVIADIGLALNLVLIVGVLALFKATLTLPGIAGILLTAGMAVDANILIFERIREELKRGSALKQAVQAGYDRAFWTIFDANLTTALTAIILMWVGTGPIKGFGVTLTIGILSSMFTALFVTRWMFGMAVIRGVATSLHFRRLFEQTSLDFWAAWPKALVLSFSLIVGGWLVFLGRGEHKYGIDFTGGTVLQMRLKHPVRGADVERRIQDHFRAQGLDASRLRLEVQRVGFTEGETSSEWLIRTRLAGGSPGDSQQSSLFQLLPAAYGQEGGDTAPVTSPAEGDTAPVTSPAQAEPSPVASAPVAPVEEEEAASEEEQAGVAAADFFEKEIRKEFKEELVQAFPREDGKFPRVEAQGDKAKVTIRVHLARIMGANLAEQTGDQAGITPAELTGSLPAVLHELKADRELRKGGLSPELAAIYDRLAGPDGFQVSEVRDADPGEGLQAFDVSFTVNNVQQDVQDAVETIENALAQAKDVRVGGKENLYTPAFAFPTVDQIGGAVAKNLKSKALVATFFSVVCICLYVWLRFDFWAGISAIVALFHDVLALLGFLSILDWLLTEVLKVHFDVKFNLTTISAFLTLIGYSINDTIVILDRIREDKALAKSKVYTPEIVNAAINKTLSRTVLTSFTTMLTVAVLFVGSFAGLTAIQGLSVALLFGLIVGTYSSVFVAAPLLLADRRKVVIVGAGLAAFLLASSIASVFMGA